MLLWLGVAFVSSAAGTVVTGGQLRPVATITVRYIDHPPLLAADGGRVAVTGDDFENVRVWNPVTREQVMVDICDSGMMEVALAADQVGDICLEETLSLDQQEVGYNERRKGRWLDPRRGYFSFAVADSGCAQSCLGNVTGAGRLLVFNTWRTMRAKKLAGRWWVWKVVDGRKIQLLTDSQPIPVVAVDSGRIFIRRSDQLLVFDSSGRPLRAYPSLGEGTVYVDGDAFVCRTRAGVTVFNLERGTIERRWNLPVQAHLRDTNSRSFVYTVGATIHIHRLLEPRDEAFPLQRVRGQVDAQLTAAGLFFAWEDSSGETGHVAFVPRDRLPVAIR
jgi:hypothetical protein